MTSTICNIQTCEINFEFIWMNRQENDESYHMNETDLSRFVKEYRNEKKIEIMKIFVYDFVRTLKIDIEFTFVSSLERECQRQKSKRKCSFFDISRINHIVSISYLSWHIFFLTFNIHHLRSRIRLIIEISTASCGNRREQTLWSNKWSLYTFGLVRQWRIRSKTCEATN